jgi:hypothetical protein
MYSLTCKVIDTIYTITIEGAKDEKDAKERVLKSIFNSIEILDIKSMDQFDEYLSIQESFNDE